MSETDIPVITIDGPSASGKGTISKRVAEALGWWFLDSGALYRVLALAAGKAGVDWTDGLGLTDLAINLPVTFKSSPERPEAAIYLADEDVSMAIRTEHISVGASKVASFAGVRDGLLARQKAFRKAPGLVADGRDMGTVVFPEARWKFFLTASPEERANRRFKQLKDRGLDVILDDLLKEVVSRDERDSKRAVAPLKPALGSVVIDTTGVSVDAVFNQVMTHCKSADKTPV